MVKFWKRFKSSEKNETHHSTSSTRPNAPTIHNRIVNSFQCEVSRATPGSIDFEFFWFDLTRDWVRRAFYSSLDFQYAQLDCFECKGIVKWSFSSFFKVLKKFQNCLFLIFFNFEKQFSLKTLRGQLKPRPWCSKFSSRLIPFDSSHKQRRPVYSSKFSIRHHPIKDEFNKNFLFPTSASKWPAHCSFSYWQIFRLNLIILPTLIYLTSPINKSLEYFLFISISKVYLFLFFDFYLSLSLFWNVWSSVFFLFETWLSLCRGTLTFEVEIELIIQIRGQIQLLFFAYWT